jgi:hypothetical protein
MLWDGFGLLRVIAIPSDAFGDLPGTSAEGAQVRPTDPRIHEFRSLVGVDWGSVTA